MEVGKRLLEPQSNYRKLNGFTAQEYLAKAEKLFREMDLQWDLEQLERVRAGAGGWIRFHSRIGPNPVAVRACNPFF